MSASVSVTITIEGSEDDVFARLRSLIDDWATAHAIAPVADRRLTAAKLSNFVDGLTPVCREIVETITRASAEGRGVSRAIIVSQVGFPVQQFSGALGAVATRWATAIGGQSPFVGRDDRNSGDKVYRIEADLATSILTILDAA